VGGLWLKASLVQWLEEPGSGDSASMLRRLSYVGSPGEWEQDDEEEALLTREDALLSEQEPQWLLALPAGCIEAQDRGVIELGDDRWHHYRTGCDFAQVGPGDRASGRSAAF
jgi:hypothetical protein